MKKLTKFAVDYPVTILMAILGICILGYISYARLGVDLLPDLNSPRLFVEIEAGEKAPEEIEKQYVEQIEALSMRQQGVTQVSSLVRIGSAQLTVEYNWEKDMDEAFLDLQKSLNDFNQGNELERISVTQYDPNSAPIMLIGISHSEITDLNELRKVAENYLSNELVRLEGVAQVSLSGELEQEVVISPIPYKMEAFEITMDAIAQKIQSYNQNISGGTVQELGLNYTVKGIGMLETEDDFNQLIVGYKEGQSQNSGVIPNAAEAANTGNSKKSPIYLKDVAETIFTNKKPKNIVRVNGHRCIGLSIFKENRFNTVKAVEEISAELDAIRDALPGYQFEVISNQGTFIKNAIDEVQETALIGIGLAVVVLFFFLRRFGTTLIISIAIPISIVATFTLMYFNGLTINIMTLGGLALGAGMLVDNAIVVLENIFRNHEAGADAKTAAIQGTAEVGGAITASTLTTIIVFLPVIYLQDAAGELFKDQAWTVAFSLVSSLFVAIFVIPMLYHRFYKNRTLPKQSASFEVNGYGKVLKGLLKFRWIVILLAALLVAAAVYIFPSIGTEFMPSATSKKFKMDVAMQEGTVLERTAATVSNVEEIIQEGLADDLKFVYSHIGPKTDPGGGQSAVFQGEHTATVEVALIDSTKLGTHKVIAALDAAMSGIPGVQFSFSPEVSSLSSILRVEESPLMVEVKGEELDVIETLTQSAMEKLSNIPELLNLRTSIEQGAPEVEILFDRFKLGLYNLDMNSVVTQIQDQLKGKNIGRLERSGEMIDIQLQLPEQGIKEFENMTIKGGEKLYRLNEIATLKTSSAAREIHRRNQTRIGKVYAQANDDETLEFLAQKMRVQLDEIDLPPNYSISVVGDELRRQESMKSLTFSLILSIILVYMVMASQFESLLHPFTILLTIPLAVVGTIATFYWLEMPLSIMAIIGIIMLVGIAVNDAIILVDRINQLKRGGLARYDAIVQAGQQRIRPILMTSLTTVLALLPLTFGFGESASLRAPMAWAVVGGLVTSTFLTLVVIPCVYAVIDFGGNKVEE
ncbi:efflux RND transporter permease subunit [Portibacter lacus]|uniref:Acriflavine resistance protein B n=1 Tax=Portibacter lacus TaxID=1099794 RepID=A0AA37STI7_9BACT|nr:efflux RND transporter permease subunit [Portibacter lacus]GLR19862.1 acriflavine resistance protein B [Portibacter lacus]